MSAEGPPRGANCAPPGGGGVHSPGPLAGMRVLELAQIMAGPTAGMMLADMGADVVKVEKLPGGDDARSYLEPRINGVSAPFLMLNRNKRGIAVNLKHAKGRELLLRLVRDADVLTENYRKGTLEKLGLGYDAFAHRLARHLGDERAAIRDQRHQAVVRKPAQRLAQGRARHAQPVAEQALVEPRAGLELALDDQLAQMLGDRPGERALVRERLDGERGPVIHLRYTNYSVD